jgi:psp operon transcriptional activator
MRPRSDDVIGNSAALAAALDHLSQLAAIDRPVLVLGERGTGKEMAAGRLHFLSPRWDAPFLKVNCAAMAESLLDTELFGHEAGAFTGATRQHIGRFERADGGTLLLDEIGTMSPRLQEKLLRLIEYGEFERIGGQKTLRVDVRVIGATHADLRALAEAGEFRHDLLDRLSFDVVHLPPLRSRGDDVMLLAEHFAVQLCAELGWPLFPGFSPAAEALLRSHHWPGNIRELKNAVERSLYRAGDAEQPLDELIVDPFDNPYGENTAGRLHGHPRPDEPEAGRGAHAPVDAAAAPEVWLSQPTGLPEDLRSAVNDYERQLLQTALERYGYNQSRCAEALGLTYNQMRGLVRKHGITSRPTRKDSAS